MPDIDLELLKAEVESRVRNISSGPALESLRIEYLGRKGIMAGLTGRIPMLPEEERADFGRKVNSLKERITALINEKQESFAAKPEGIKGACVDIGMPGIAQEIGRLHPITQIIDEICAIFLRLGFSVVEGPEIETEYNNFTGLNIPLEHPSRDAFDTFYIKSGSRLSVIGSRISEHRTPNTEHRFLLRSHTSPVQIRVMKSQKPPLAVVVPGRVYRPDAVDASHLFMFHQIEGFIVDTNITFADLKGTLEAFARGVFGRDIKMRFRPHFFPFTEPSAEVDISCIICGRETRAPSAERRAPRKKCPVCHGKGWLEILGSGMIHPNVFRNVGYRTGRYTGFAFGMGIERIAMLKYGIDDIRLFFENDLRFLRQF